MVSCQAGGMAGNHLSLTVGQAWDSISVINATWTENKRALRPSQDLTKLSFQVFSCNSPSHKPRGFTIKFCQSLWSKTRLCECTSWNKGCRDVISCSHGIQRIGQLSLAWIQVRNTNCKKFSGDSLELLNLNAAGHGGHITCHRDASPPLATVLATVAGFKTGQVNDMHRGNPFCELALQVHCRDR